MLSRRFTPIAFCSPYKYFYQKKALHSCKALPHYIRFHAQISSGILLRHCCRRKACGVHRYGKAADKTLSAAFHISPTTALRKKRSGTGIFGENRYTNQTHAAPYSGAYRVYTAASVPFLPMNRYCLMINLCTMFHRFQLYRVDSPCNLIGFCCKCHW